MLGIPLTQVDSRLGARGANSWCFRAEQHHRSRQPESKGYPTREYLKTLDIRPDFVVLPGFGHNGRAYADEGSGVRFLSKFFEHAPAR
jgi:hypothetical protein